MHIWCLNELLPKIYKHVCGRNINLDKTKYARNSFVFPWGNNYWQEQEIDRTDLNRLEEKNEERIKILL